MYSIVKSQRRKLSHLQKSSITAATFVNNNHIVFCFANGVVALVKGQDSKSEDEIVSFLQIPNGVPIHQCVRTSPNTCILITKFCKFVYQLKVNNGLQLEKLAGTTISTVIEQSLQDPVFLNAAGFSTQLFGFENGNFALKHIMNEDRKVYVNIYQKGFQQSFKIHCKQLDLHIGEYVIELCDRIRGEFAFYKQGEIQQVDWQLRAIYVGQQGLVQEVITLPVEFFDSQTTVTQVVRWSQVAHLVIALNKNSGEIKLFLWNRNQQHNFIEPFKTLKLLPSFKQIIYTNPLLQVCYAVNYAHIRINGQLYENAISVINTQNGDVIQTGYCTLKSINISPDGRKILDYANQFQANEQALYHIRLLFQKKSLYMFLLDSLSVTRQMEPSFKESIFSLL